MDLTLLGPVLVAALAFGTLVLLRAAGAGRCAVLAGVCAGLLLGPGVMGRLVPDVYERVVVGAQTEREARDSVLRRQDIERAAARAAFVDESAAGDLHARHLAELDSIARHYTAARWEAARPMRIATALLAAIMLALLARARTNALSTDVRTRGGWLSLGMWMMLLPAGVSVPLLIYLLDVQPHHALLFGCALAVAAPGLTLRERALIDRIDPAAHEMIARAMKLAAIVPLGLSMAFIVQSAEEPHRLETAATAIVPMIGLLAGWMMLRRSPSKSSADQRVATTEVRDVSFAMLCSCALAALAAVRIDLSSHLAVGMVIVAALFSTDARWMGAFTGLRLAGVGPAARALRLGLAPIGAAWSQTALSALFMHLDAGSEPTAMVCALLAGAAVMELSAPLRWKLDEQMEELAGEDAADDSR